MLRPHLEVEKRVLRYLKCPLEKVFDMPLIDILLFLPMKMRIGPARRQTDRRSTTGYCTFLFLGGSHVEESKANSCRTVECRSRV